MYLVAGAEVESTPPAYGAGDLAACPTRVNCATREQGVTPGLERRRNGTPAPVLSLAEGLAEGASGTVRFCQVPDKKKGGFYPPQFGYQT